MPGSLVGVESNRPLEATTAVIRRPTQVCELDSGPIEYRLDRRGSDVLLIMQGVHLRAGLALGEDAFASAGCTVLVPSRPGYGRTPLRTDPTPVRFADAVAELCARLGITRVAAVVGISGGGPSAVTLAARHPGLVQRVVLISAVGFLPWPDRRTRLGAHVVFRPGVEGAAWAAVRLLVCAAPAAALRLLLGSVSTRRGATVAAGLRDGERDTVLALFSAMRSGHGFLNDLRSAPDLTAAVPQPALVIASRADGGVPFAHAESLAATIPGASLVESQAPSHLVRFNPDWPVIAERVTAFLTTPVTAASAAGPPPATSHGPSTRAFHRPLRRATAGLALAGTLLAAGTAGPAFTGLGAVAGLTFAAVALALTARRGCTAAGGLATPVSVLGLAGQPVVTVGALWRVAAGVPAVKAAELHRLGVPAPAGAWIELSYGLIGATLFGWLVARWWHTRATHRPLG